MASAPSSALLPVIRKNLLLLTRRDVPAVFMMFPSEVHSIYQPFAPHCGGTLYASRSRKGSA